MNKLLKVKCPHCDKVFPYYESKSRPFCSDRCKMIDLGHWFEESYTVPENEVNKIVQNKNEKLENEKNKSLDSHEEETSSEDYPQIDEDTYDENDY